MLNTNKKYTRYIITSDESVKKGKHYSYFYGGAIIKESEYDDISQILNIYKSNFGLHELKRTKISKCNINEYIKVIDLFFTYVLSGKIKVRIMYAPNDQLNKLPQGQDDAYNKLYYTFLKAGFSLFNAKENIMLRLLLDELPEEPIKRKTLKNCIVRNFNDISKNNYNKVLIYKNRIQEANSKTHPILQCVDVIVGTIEFYLNNKNEEILSTKGQMKLKIFNHIYNNYIKPLNPNFDFNQSTGYFKCYKAWISPYKHLVYKKIPELST